MAKRHHRSIKKVAPEYYAGMDERRALEHRDGEMIHEAMGNFANLPSEVMFKMYPQDRYYLDGALNDGISGIDKQMDYDGAKQKGGLSPWKV